MNQQEQTMQSNESVMYQAYNFEFDTDLKVAFDDEIDLKPSQDS